VTQALHSSSWASPSNIALIKYWGKHGLQLPANPSISFTLDACRTETKLELHAPSDEQIKVFLDDVEQSSFVPKIEKFLSHIGTDFPWLKNYSLQIHTTNTFPHSSGIASSASGMSALALCLCELHEKINGSNFNDFYKSASHYARIGSGSASRSVYGGLVSWGMSEFLNNSSDEYATPYTGDVHSVFKDFQDTILLVHQGSKSVSSSVGHDIMNNHAFAEQRFALAHQNLNELLDAISSGDLPKFTEIVEHEALMLHGLMMSSRPYFILMKPNTLQIIEKIWEHRKQNCANVLFTLDAGANVHLLYPKSEKSDTLNWIERELKPFCEKGAYICDEVGQGPQRLEP